MKELEGGEGNKSQGPRELEGQAVSTEEWMGDVWTMELRNNLPEHMDDMGEKTKTKTKIISYIVSWVKNLLG